MARRHSDSDFLSSIEVLIVDQLDVMLMQNWDHVHFVLDRLNHLPATDHGIDFSRVKPWYLDGLASFLRQSILLSAFDAPEVRGAWTRACRNRAGRARGLGMLEGEAGVLERVPQGVRQVWSRFDVGEVTEEDDKRFEWFTTKVRAHTRSSGCVLSPLCSPWRLTLDQSRRTPTDPPDAPQVGRLVLSDPHLRPLVL